MSTDLPIIPCYKDNNCASEFNCGTDTLDCNLDTAKICSTNETLFEASCFGNNSEYCQGVLSQCDINSTFVKCNEDNQNPTLGGVVNSDGLLMGCGITSNNTTFPPNFSNIDSYNACMEFENKLDSIVPDVAKVCWQTGGYTIVKNLCETKIGGREFECKAMNYFCEWDESKKLCTLASDRINTSPLEKFNNTYGSIPDKIYIRQVRTDCSGLSSDECVEINNPSYDDTTLYVNSAQSAWDSQKQTSYDINQRIDCLHSTKDPNFKICIATPRCQVVNSPCECGSRETDYYSRCSNFFENRLDPPCSQEPLVTEDLLFMCSKIDYIVGDENDYNIGSKYVTWCKGYHSDKEYRVPEKRSKILTDLGIGIIPIKREEIDWNLDSENNCNNRCSNYNECESSKSEELFNKCIYDKSHGKYGVNYNSNSFINGDKLKILREQGLCLDNNSIDFEEMRQYSLLCEQELEYLGSINWGRVFGPNGSETSACQYRYNWTHTCIVAPDDTQIAENYVCTWCPSLQCKIGSKDEICSEIVEGTDSWNGLPQCDTDKEHGEMVRKDLPRDCDCFLPKTKIYKPGGIYPYKSREDAEIVSTLLGGATVSTLMSMALIALL